MIRTYNTVSQEEKSEDKIRPKENESKRKRKEERKREEEEKEKRRKKEQRRIDKKRDAMLRNNNINNIKNKTSELYLLTYGFHHFYKE